MWKHMGDGPEKFNKIMTLKQLLDSLPFEEIAPFIRKYDRRNTLASYKQHFDYLRHLEPAAGTAGEARVGYWEDLDWAEDVEKDKSDDGGGRLFAGDLEGDCWESSLARTLAIDEEVTESPAEIAACCLWHTSFYGFLPEDTGETFVKFHVSKARARYHLSKFRDIIPSRSEMLSVPSFHQTVRREMRIHRRYKGTKLDRDLPGMRGLGQRKWRYWKRWEINNLYFRRIEMDSEYIETVLERGTDAINPPAGEEFGRLFRANHVSILSCETLSYNAADRLGYFRDLVEKYGMLEEATRLPNSFVCVSASPEHPLSDAETEEIRSLVTSGHGGEHRIWTKSDGSCGEDLRVDIAYYG